MMILNNIQTNLTMHELDQIYKEITAGDTNVYGGCLTPNIGRRKFIGALISREL